MKAPRNRISKTIAARTLKGGSGKKLAQEIAAYLLTERRTSELNSVLRDVQADWAEAGHVEVVASSAHSLSAAVRSNIDKQVKQLYPAAKQIIVTEVIDPEIIGGVRLSLANQQLDLSVEAKLNKFKQLTLSGKEQ
jgi:F-type H+-transporting ATPase subunit delta